MLLLASITVGQAACGLADPTLVVLDSGRLLCRLLDLSTSTESRGGCQCMSPTVGRRFVYGDYGCRLPR